jgi:hypothetical protein
MIEAKLLAIAAMASVCVDSIVRGSHSILNMCGGGIESKGYRLFPIGKRPGREGRWQASARRGGGLHIGPRPAWFDKLTMSGALTGSPCEASNAGA